VSDENILKEIRLKKEEWEHSFHNTNTSKKKFKAGFSGVPVQEIYTPLDLEDRGFDYLNKLGFPGEYPFTRGVNPLMYRERPWLIKMYSGFGCPEDSNLRYKYLLDLGVEDLHMAVDLPTQVGYDSDHFMAKGEVGRVGVAIDSLRDMEIIFDGIPLSSFKRVGMLGNSFGPIALALFIALGERQGINPENYTIDLQNDVLKEYIVRGTQIFPIRPALKFAVDVIEYCGKKYPHWFPMTICGSHMKDAGLSSPHALGLAMANALEYIQELARRGLSVEDYIDNLVMFLLGDINMFSVIATLRAARRIWANLLRERFKVEKKKSLALNLQDYANGGCTAQQPLNNIVRIAFAALYAALGGVQFLYSASWDEGLNIPSEQGVQLSVRTQQIVSNETGVTDVIDPLGGSYYLETLTDQIEEEAYKVIKKVDKLGGAIPAIEAGFYSQMITEEAFTKMKDLEKMERIVVGVNKFKVEESIPHTFKVNRNVEKRQVERLRLLKKERDNRRVKETLKSIEESAQEKENLIGPIVDAVRAYATIGEICNILRKVFGEFKWGKTYI
jgi:methylmalonyl-CoA mutase N-terminal domain/subunit